LRFFFSHVSQTCENRWSPFNSSTLTPNCLERLEVLYLEALQELFVQAISGILGRHAREYSEFLGIDLATGAPFLGK
jgi:hypothetical protein